MKIAITFLPKAISDQADIKKHLSQYYPGTSKRFFSLLKKKIARLKTYPYSCPKYEDDPDYRKLVVGDYLVFYMLNEDAKIVEVHRILHGSRDISQHLYEQLRVLWNITFLNTGLKDLSVLLRISMMKTGPISLESEQNV